MQINLTDDLPLIRADYTQIALVLTNLLENAVKYAAQGTDIMLSAATTYNGYEDAPTGVTLTVRDFGPGISPDEAEHLFERFYRGHAHRDSSIHGTGLGLALCQAIIRAHAGRICAGNAPTGEPSGAVFSVFLPLNDTT